MTDSLGQCYFDESNPVGSLYCVGEAASTGLHGGNRLASTSLLEGVVWGDTVGKRVREKKFIEGMGEKPGGIDHQPLPAHPTPHLQQPDEDTLHKLKTRDDITSEAKSILREVRSIMSSDVSVVMIFLCLCSHDLLISL